MVFYLVAILDWFSRYVLPWEQSHSLDVLFFLSDLERVLTQSIPLIFNNDQGRQCSFEAFTARLEVSNIAIRWNGRGSYYENILIERCWHGVKYEEEYLNGYDSMNTAQRRLRDYFNFYNRERSHQLMGYRTPYEVYFH
ncbi:MAG: integrase core domain-containing protein [Candidatus Poribacteria bacterium]|nr:integrase core domain-containing protein [Candidatus Poribacteria bacterium]